VSLCATTIAAPQCGHAPKEETQRSNVIHHRSHRQFSFMQQMSLPLADMVRAQLIWRLTKEARKPLDGAEVTAYSV
jgi:hypothetical protein